MGIWQFLHAVSDEQLESFEDNSTYWSYLLFFFFFWVTPALLKQLLQDALQKFIKAFQEERNRRCQRRRSKAEQQETKTEGVNSVDSEDSNTNETNDDGGDNENKDTSFHDMDKSFSPLHFLLTGYSEYDIPK